MCVFITHGDGVRPYNSNQLSPIVYTTLNTFVCATKNVVYLLTCQCGKQYVGRTIWAFSVRVNEHITLIKKGGTKHNVPRHYRQFHNRDPTGTEFLIIDRYIPPWRGGAMTRDVSRLETYWIYELECHSPMGPNLEYINASINNMPKV